MRLWAIVLAACLGAAAGHPDRWGAAAADPTQDARGAAAGAGAALGLDAEVGSYVEAMRLFVVNDLRRVGLSEPKAVGLAETAYLPALRSRAPDLMAAWQGVLLDAHTLPELEALRSGEPGGAMDGAKSKWTAVLPRLRLAAKVWGLGVILAVDVEHRQEIEGLLGRRLRQP